MTPEFALGKTGVEGDTAAIAPELLPIFGKEPNKTIDQRRLGDFVQECFYTPLVLCCSDGDDNPTCDGHPTSDQQKRMRLQHYISNEAPFYEITWIGTHNSYNAESYTGYPFPQQGGSITDQLEAGLRILSLDIHTLNGKVVLCHDGALSGTLCASSDRELIESLREIKDFLVKNPEDVVLVIIEDWLENKNARTKTANDLDQLFRGMAFTPQDRGHSGYGCRTLPVFDDALTKAWLLKNGKQIIFATDSTGNTCCFCPDEGKQFRRRVWHVDVKEHSAGEINSGRMIQSPTLNFFAEDRLITNKIIRSDGHGMHARRILESGVHGIGLDWYDKVNRFDSLIWSWAPNQPNCNPLWTACCVFQQVTDGQWTAADCAGKRVYACQDSHGHWSVTTVLSTGLLGWDKCGAKKNVLPVNSNYNKQLRDAADLVRAGQIWLPYHYIYGKNKWNLLTSLPNCGKQDQRACCDLEGSSKCKSGFSLNPGDAQGVCSYDTTKSGGGTCIDLHCGGDGESACCPAEAIEKNMVASEADAIASGQTGYCDPGLKHVPLSEGGSSSNCQIWRAVAPGVHNLLIQSDTNGTCVRCGGEDERPCTSSEASYNCDNGLVISNAMVCIVPTCGELSERSCCSGERDDGKECIDGLEVWVPEDVSSLRDCENLGSQQKKSRGECRYPMPSTRPSLSRMPSTLPSASPSAVPSEAKKVQPHAS